MCSGFQHARIRAKTCFYLVFILIMPLSIPRVLFLQHIATLVPVSCYVHRMLAALVSPCVAAHNFRHSQRVLGAGDVTHCK